MTLHDFANGVEPWLAFGRDVDVAQIRKWYDEQLIFTREFPVDFQASLFQLTDKGRRQCGLLVIDVARWPYQCGKLDRSNGKARDWHETNATNHAKSGLQPGSECHALWVAGWDAGK